MAKIVGISGTIRGKIGTLVFVKGENGVSYGKSYQPVVSNPRTPGQLMQRAKVNAVGRISRAASSELIAALGGSRKMNRRIFNSEMLKNAVVMTTQDGYMATVNPQNVMFSKGAEVLHASFTNATVSANKISYTMTLRDVEYGGMYGERVVIGVILPEDKAGVSYFLKDDVIFPDSGGQAPTAIVKEILFPQDIDADTMVVVWRCPFVISSIGMNVVTEKLYNDDNEIVAKLLTSGAANFRGWGDSTVQLTEVFTTA